MARTTTTAGRCRLTLEIDGRRYDVRPLRGDLGRGVVIAWRLAPSGTTTLHLVEETLDGPTCSCGDQVWRHRGRDATVCKHIRALRALGLLP